MPLKIDLAASFSSSMRQNGEWLYHGGNVKIVSGDDTHVEALVKGGMKYEVSMQRHQSLIKAACTCPYSMERDPCKHIWAVILAADDRTYLSGNAEGSPARLAKYRETLTPPPKPPAWLKLIENVNRTANGVGTFRSEEWRPDREVFYVIELSSSGYSNSLSLDIEVRERNKNGKYGKLKEHKITRSQLAQIPTAEDREILSALAGAPPTYVSMYSDEQIQQTFRLTPPFGNQLLEKACSTGRCMLRLKPGDPIEEMIALSWDDGPPWEFRLRMDKQANSYAVSGQLVRQGEQIDITAPTLLLPDGIILVNNRIGLYDHGGASAWAAALRKQSPINIEFDQAHDFQRELLRLPQVPKAEWPEELEYAEVSPQPKPAIHIGPSDWRARGTPDALAGKVSFDYEGEKIPHNMAGQGVFDPEKRRFLRRSLTFEKAAIQRLTEAGLKKILSFGNEPYWEVPQKRLPQLVRDLLKEGWHIEAEGKIFRRASSFDIEVSSGIDWFELRGSIDYGGTSVTLPQLIRAIRKGENLIQLGDGSFGMLPEDFLAKYHSLLQLGSTEEDYVKYTRTQAGILDVFLAEREVRADEEFQRAREQLRAFDGVQPAPQPANFHGELRGYQCEGLGWLQFLNKVGWGGCLADDMGVGKTAQVLALLETRREINAGPSLVVVPRSLIYNWKQEAARFTPLLSVLDNSGIDRVKDPINFRDFNLVLTTYGTLRRDILELRNFQFDYVILDEAQAIKNAASESAKAARLLTAKNRLAMSGTPIENHLGELWSLFEFLNPGMMGGVSVLQSASTLRNPDEDTRRLLGQAVRPFILRRTKSQVVKDLPEKSEQTIYCELDRGQRKLYDELRDYYRAKLLGRLDEQELGRAKLQILEALLRLRQAACHPALIDDKHAAESSAKLETLLPQLDEVTAEGHKALVFSQFTSFLALLRQQLDADGVTYEYLDGATQNRQAHVERFQNDPDCKLFLVSLKAGGLGLNLTAADYVFLLDPWWNPAVEAQAIDRTHRIGQTKPVFAYRLIARDTVEEKVLELQKSKRALAEAIISEDNRFVGNLKREDLEILFS